jgi:hypothetical protein
MAAAHHGVDVYDAAARMIMPRIIHMMHFPWDADQRLKADPEDFDRRHVEAMRQYASGFDVQLWTLPRVRALCESRYPEVWQALQSVARPVMMVDVLRWVVVHAFGGIYWQMNTVPLAPMTAYLPSERASVRLFTEFELSPDQCRSAATEPIRAGVPEEPTRVLIQVFSARPGAPFVRRVIDFLLERVATHTPRRDYDILYITGNAAVSTAYDLLGRTDPAVERTDLETSRRLMKWHYRGSWRTGAAKSAPLPSWPSFPGVDRWAWLRAARHRVCGNSPAWASDSVSAPAREALRAWMGGMGLRRVWEREASASVHARIPSADVVMIHDELERRGDAEVMRILARCIRSRARFLALTHHPLLCDLWPGADGDYRPLNFRLPPFCFPAPVAAFPSVHPERRTDRELAVWDVGGLKGCLA